MDHNLEGGAVEIVVNPNLSSGVIGNRLEGSLNLDRNIVVTADDDGRLTASTIQPEGSAFCLVCDNLIKDRRNVDVRHLFIADSVTLHTQQQVGTLLAHVLNVNHLDHEEVYSDVLCRRCGRLLDELDEVEQRSIVIRNKIQDWYNKSVLRRLKNPNDPSIEAYDDLDLSEDEAVTSVIKVKSAPVESDLDDDPLLDELRPEDQGIRADDPEFNPFYDVQRRQRGRGRGRGGRSRGRGRGRGRGRVGRPPKYGVTKYPPVSSTGSIVSAGEKFGQLVTKILGDEETSPMDTDIETEKGEVATNTDQQTEKGEIQNLIEKEQTKDLTDNSHSCSQCSYRSTSAEDLENHSLTHAKYSCPECGLALVRPSQLKHHLKVIHGIQDHDQNSSGGKKKFPCSICGKVYASAGGLHNHRISSHSGKSYVCVECGRKFSHPKNLASHILRHKSRSVKCTECDATFYLRNELNKHINQVHRKCRPYVCEDCGRSFCQRSVLKHHRMVHTDHRLLFCPLCSRSFKTSVAFSHHLEQHQKKLTSGTMLAQINMSAAECQDQETVSFSEGSEPNVTVSSETQTNRVLSNNSITNIGLPSSILQTSELTLNHSALSHQTLLEGNEIHSIGFDGGITKDKKFSSLAVSEDNSSFAEHKLDIISSMEGIPDNIITQTTLAVQQSRETFVELDLLASENFRETLTSEPQSTKHIVADSSNSGYTFSNDSKRQKLSKIIQGEEINDFEPVINELGLHTTQMAYTTDSSVSTLSESFGTFSQSHVDNSDLLNANTSENIKHFQSNFDVS